ncbi:MAG: 1,6-anhydro-N-acetylmuramyl-L-alanine amidase AmpD [Pseudomonadales bacterium]
MRVTEQHWLDGAARLESPNSNERPDPSAIELVVVHGISLPPGRFGGRYVHDLFLNRLDIAAHPAFADLAEVRVSAHLLISRRGALTQFVPFHRRAWHAGVSSWRRRPNCNDYAIGIELEGSDDRPYTRSQYHRLRQVLEALLARYPRLSPEAVVGHCEIAPGRKTDPGPGFSWRRLFAGVS